MNLKKLGCTAFLIFSFSQSLNLLTACSDWNDHYESAANGGAAGGTLWEQLKANPQLSDFCDVLEQTKVYRMHKKTPVSYADLLGSGQAFTVAAPVNNTFNKDSLLRLVETVAGDSAVEKSFIQNHMTRSLTSSTAKPTKMLMLNMKHLMMEDGRIDNVPMTKENLRTDNGILHILEHALPYKYNIFELLCDNPSLSAIGDNLRHFNKDEFDEAASVQNGVIDGVPVYVDSVIIELNPLLDAIGKLRDEDSTYLVVAPTTDGWTKAYNEASEYFKYDETVDKRDSLQQYFTMRALMEDAIFNMTDQKNIVDSLISVPYIHSYQHYEKGKHVYHVFYRPFQAEGILYGAQKYQCSNGMLYATEQWPFKPEDTYFKEIYVEGEDTYLMTDYTGCVYSVRNQTADSISNNRYLSIVPVSATSNWTTTFQLNNTLSGSYDVYAIILPKSVDPEDKNPDMKPCKFKASINYLDEKGKAQTFACAPEASDAHRASASEFKSIPECADTVLLAREFKFPACNYGQSNMNFSIKIQCSITARQTAQYAREMYLDCIYLRPRSSKSEEQ